MTLAWRALRFGAPLRQPDQRSCGPSCAVVARMVRDADYARSIAPRFGDEVLRVHGRLTGSRDAAGAIQLPWPRALGTPPWALARQLSDSGPTYRWRLVRWGRSTAFERVLAGVSSDQPVAIYAGSTLLPRHVVLALEVDDDAVMAYDPARGAVTRVEGDDFRNAKLGLSGWDVPWFTVTPRHP